MILFFFYGQIFQAEYLSIGSQFGLFRFTQFWGAADNRTGQIYYRISTTTRPRTNLQCLIFSAFTIGSFD